MESVFEYSYNGKTLYYFISCHSFEEDSGTFLDENGNEICDMTPPFVPTGKPSCVYIYHYAIKGELIWEK